ncbi:hypothetical protein, partial [Frankia sp. AvcI1]
AHPDDEVIATGATM